MFQAKTAAVHSLKLGGDCVYLLNELGKYTNVTQVWKSLHGGYTPVNWTIYYLSFYTKSAPLTRFGSLSIKPCFGVSTVLEVDTQR